MNNKTKTILGVLLFIGFIAVATSAYNILSEKVSPVGDLLISQSSGEIKDESSNVNNSSENSSSFEKERPKAPDITLVDNDGNEIMLSSLFGKPIVLNFWASWCPPCKMEMPEFNKVYEEMGEDITFMMVDLVDGQRETVEKGKAHIEEQKYTFPVYFDTKGEAGYAYGIASIPSTLFIDKDGYIITGAQGAIDEKTLRKGIGMISDK